MISAAVRSELTNSGAPLVSAAALGSAPKFADIYAGYFRFVWSTARYMGVETKALDDVVQDVFVIIYERVHTLQQREALRSWSYGIVRRVVLTHHRTQRSALNKAEELLVNADLIHPVLPTPQQITEESERAKLFWSLVSVLDERKREVFLLAEFEEMTAPEIAKLTNLPLNTVYSRLRAAREELEEALRRHIIRTQKRGRLCAT